MAALKIQIMEQCQVSAPTGSVPTTSLPLTFLDLPWLYCCAVQRLFFFDFPHSTHHFLHTLLPTLKHSLSLTLQHFFPFAGNLLLPPDLLKRHPYILYHDGDFIPFTVAESSADFSRLVSDSPIDVTEFHHLTPVLPAPHKLEDGTRLIPLMTIQVTILPNSGLAIGVSFTHVVGDGRAFHQFMKFWAFVCRNRGDLSSLPLPCHTRGMIQDPKDLKLLYLEELMKVESKSMEFAGLVSDVCSDKVRATFVLDRDQMEKLKKWVGIRYKGNGTGTPQVSTFVLTCSLIWVCIIKSEKSQDSNVVSSLDEPCNLVFLADCRNHSELTIPSTYFGNCLAFSFVVLKRGQLVGGNEFVEAVNIIGSEVREIKSDPSRGAETLMSDMRKLSKSGQPLLTVAGSTRLGVYDTDFGWGKPRKSKVIHIETSGFIALSDGRHKDVAVEIEVALRRTQMKHFTDILEEQLRNISI